MLDPSSNPQSNLQQLQNYLKRGAVDPKFPFRYLTLTTTEAGLSVPTARMLVLRDIDDEGHFILFSDARSEKVAALSSNPIAHLLFWHPRKQVQVGVHAEIQIHQKDSLANHYMERVSGHGKQQYTSVKAPSSPIDKPEEGLEFEEDSFEDHFCVLRARPWRITALQLRREGHLRLRFDKKGNTWEGGWIMP